MKPWQMTQDEYRAKSEAIKLAVELFGEYDMVTNDFKMNADGERFDSMIESAKLGELSSEARLEFTSRPAPNGLKPDFYEYQMRMAERLNPNWTYAERISENMRLAQDFGGCK